MQEIQRAYRLYQIFNQHAFGLYGKIAPELLSLGEILATVATYMIIRLPVETGIALDTCACFMAIATNIYTMVIIMDTNSVTNASIRFSQLMSSPETSQVSKYNNRFFKSCYPLYFKMRGIYTISDGTVMRVYNDIIINYVISLLLIT